MKLLNIIFIMFCFIAVSCNNDDGKIEPDDKQNDTVAQDTIDENDTTEIAYFEDEFFYELGSTTVSIYRIQHGDKPITYYNMHENETTSIEAGDEVILDNQGRFIRLKSEGNRNVTFTLNGENYTFDPNRIYTQHGAEATLKSLGNYSEEARDITYDFAMQVVDTFILDVKLVVTLHNNSAGGYSARSYLPGGSYAADNATVYIKDGTDPDDFFYVTEQRFYDYLTEKGYNVVLQNNEEVVDDGSLSVFCGYNDISYINVEAQSGHLDEQLEMLDAVTALIADLIDTEEKK